MEYFVLYKNVTFWNEGTFTLVSSVQGVPVLFKRKDLRVSAKYWFIYRSMYFVYPILTFKTSVKMLGDQLAILLSEYYHDAIMQRRYCQDIIRNRGVIVLWLFNFNDLWQKSPRLFSRENQFVDDFQWARRHIWLNGTRSAGISIDISPNRSN